MDSKQKEFLVKKEKWLNEVSDDCHQFALKTNLDFYVFQTSCENYRPDLLIIGINPRGGISYQEQLIKKGYSKRPPSDLGYNENTLIAKPQWEKLKGSDVLRNRFSRVFNDENNLNILSNTVMMNMFYFNTIQAKEIGLISKEIKDYCINKTQEFIEILNPKNILFLTSCERNLKRCSVQNIIKLDNNVKRGKLNKKTVYAIPHYGSYGAYSKDNAKKMGRTLSSIFLEKE